MVAHAMVMCLSVTSRNSIKMVEYMELVLGVVASFDLCCGNSGSLENTSALPSGTLSQTLDLNNFATASRLCCQNSSTVELVHHTYDGRRVAAV